MTVKTRLNRMMEKKQPVRLEAKILKYTGS